MIATNKERLKHDFKERFLKSILFRIFKIHESINTLYSFIFCQMVFKLLKVRRQPNLKRDVKNDGIKI